MESNDDLQRNFNEYPDDDNGEVPWQLKCHGDDHSVLRDIEFIAASDSEESALRCGAFLFADGHRIQLEKPLDDDPEATWDVLFVPNMTVDYHEVCAYEKWLAEVAANYGGRLDGWGCLAQESSHDE